MQFKTVNNNLMRVESAFLKNKTIKQKRLIV